MVENLEHITTVHHQACSNHSIPKLSSMASNLLPRPSPTRPGNLTNLVLVAVLRTPSRPNKLVSSHNNKLATSLSNSLTLTSRNLLVSMDSNRNRRLNFLIPTYRRNRREVYLDRHNQQVWERHRHLLCRRRPVPRHQSGLVSSLARRD